MAMPSTYAHYRMGREVGDRLHGTEGELVARYRELFNIGLHGPDILFYYGALGSNPVNAVGFGLHEKSGVSYFENARRSILQSQNPEAARAYAYGVLCHFALDVTCHPYVEEKIRRSGISHTEIEVEFDRKLMLLDGRDPVSHVLTDHIHPRPQWEEMIAPFYPGVTPRQVEKALHSMIFLNKLLLAKNPVKREIIYGVLRLTGNYQEMHGLIVNPGGNPACRDSNDKLYTLYCQAGQLAERLIYGFEDFLTGKAGLDPIFAYNFEGRLPKEKAA